MAKQDPAAKARKIQLTVRAQLLESSDAEQLPQTAIYAFSAGGYLLAHRTLEKQEAATLAFALSPEGGSVRVFVGPMLNDRNMTIAELQRRGAQERRVVLTEDNLAPSVEFSIPAAKWACWLFGWCFVQGKLIWRVDGPTGPIEAPICNATVEIYEVDPIHIILQRLPDNIIGNIRQIVLNPPPPPPPPPEVFTTLKSSRSQARGALVHLGSAPAGARATTNGGGGCADCAKKQRSSLMMTGSAMSPLPASERLAELAFLAKTATTFQLRQALVNYADLLKFIFCLIDLVWVTTSLVATTTTDENGHFEDYFFRRCGSPPTANLYFKAKQQVDPTPAPMRTIYGPLPVACFTFWNYNFGTEVTLYTDDPKAQTCASPGIIVDSADPYVAVLQVGGTYLYDIYGTSTTLTDSTKLGLANGDRPWGGLLRLRIVFQDQLLSKTTAAYYQVSWRQGSDPFKPLTDSLVRHYSDFDTKANTLTFKAISYSPQTVGTTPNLFQIPPVLPPSAPQHDTQWVIADPYEDITSAKFPTGIRPTAGLLDIKIALFDSAGNQITDLTGQKINYYVPTQKDSSGTISTVNASTLNLVNNSDGSFKMTLHVDDNQCTSKLLPPTLNGNQSNSCGVMKYNAATDMGTTVVMEFNAGHPNGFGTYAFQLNQGTPPQTLLNMNGPAGPGTTDVSPTMSVQSLLTMTDLSVNTTLCPTVALAMQIHVYATATDGWNRMSIYDAPPSAAGFVLTPSP